MHRQLVLGVSPTNIVTRGQTGDLATQNIYLNKKNIYKVDNLLSIKAFYVR